MVLSIFCQSTSAAAYQALDKKINSLINISQCYLFTILTQYSKEKSLGEIWAEKNGAPVRYVTVTGKSIEQVFSKIDYAIFIIDKDSQKIKNLLMKYKMTGKRGSVIFL